jgi:type I restriction enzyme S subunit
LCPKNRARYTYYLALKGASNLEGDSEKVANSTQSAFEKALGFGADAPLPDRPTFVASFKNIERWSHQGILRATLHVKEPAPKFPLVALGKLGKASYGLQKCPANRPSTHARPYLRVANVQRWRLDLKVVKLINVPDVDMPKYRLEAGDILLCEGNSPDLVGRGAIWQNEIPECVHQNHVIRVRMDKSLVIPEFVLAVINSGYGQAYFRSKAKRTTNLASINSKEVSAFPLPLPPIEEQRSLIDALFSGQSDARRIEEDARKVRAQAWADLEAAIYSISTANPA